MFFDLFAKGFLPFLHFNSPSDSKASGFSIPTVPVVRSVVVVLLEDGVILVVVLVNCTRRD